MTLVEMMVVVAVIAILAAIVLPQFSGAQEKAKAVSAGSSMLAIAKAATHYYALNEDWPADVNRRRIPPELETYLPHDDFVHGPIGGVWDFEDWRGTGRTAGGHPVGIAISIVEGDPDMYLAIDTEIDDGSLTTGNVRVSDVHPRLMYIIQFD